VSRALLTLLAVVALATAGIASSGADFTAKSSSPTTITAAADFNTVTVTLGAVGTPLSGNVPLSATASSERGIANVKFQYAPAGTTDWADVCTDSSSSYGCNWGTASIADGTYDVRALATDNAGYTKASVSTNRVVENYALSVTLDDPGAMSGSESLTATAANWAGGGINSLKIQHRAVGATTWVDLCSGTTSPRTCSLDTTALPEGDRELRAVVHDRANHYAQTTPIVRRIDNTPPQTTPSIPPQGSGQVTISAEASDSGSGIQSVAFQVFYMGQWYTVCTDTTAPYACSADSASVEDGAYQVRTVTTDNAGVVTTGSTHEIVIDNETPRGIDVTTGNAGTAGRLDQNDWIRFTWNEPMAPASILSGWTGAQQNITVNVRNAGTNGSNDEMYFTGLNLVLSDTELKLGGNYFSSNATFTNSKITQSGDSITVTLGTRSGGGMPYTVANATINWKPSSNAKDLAGRASATTNVAETSDQDF
jgi:chitinase